MSISGESTASRQFVASAEAMSTGWIKATKPHVAGSGRRFSWSGSVLMVNEPPAYILSAADWLTLVEKFSLAADLKDAARKG